LRRHRRAINDVFTQMLGLARRAGLAQLGHVAIDSTRIGANAARSSVVSATQGERDQRAEDRLKVRRFQQKAVIPDGDENGGVVLGQQQTEALLEQLQPNTRLVPLPALAVHRSQPPIRTAAFCVPAMAGCWATPRIWLSARIISSSPPGSPSRLPIMAL
jgi:hypothetical protein